MVNRGPVLALGFSIARKYEGLEYRANATGCVLLESMMTGTTVRHVS